jgi:hypothetical protein
MARTKISEFSATPGDNTDIDGIDIAEGCAPSGINNAIRELMAQLKDMQTGASGDTFTLTTVNSTTVDTTNLEATNLKAKDGTAAGSIANSTGVVTLASSVLTTTDINGGTVDGTTIGATTPSSVVATQVDITAQGDLRLQDTTGGQYVALQAPATIATSYTLTLPVDDGTSGQALITDGSGVLSWSTAASGDVYGPASATDNAVARYDGTTGKIIQNSAVTIADDGATVIDVNSTSAGLRITQIGTGNALLVEDAANPDATPFVIDNSGNAIQGNTTFNTIGTLSIGGFQAQQNSSGAVGTSVISYGTAAAAYARAAFARSPSGVIGTNAAVAINNALMELVAYGHDGTAFIPAASIQANVDGTPGTNDMPGRLVFSTTADGASSPTERMRIDAAGNVGIGTTAQAFEKLVLAGTFPSGSANTRANVVRGTIPSSTTSLFTGFRTEVATQAASFTLSALAHFNASQGTFGASSVVTNQYGFLVDSNLIGATNNYGFYSTIASGTGRWNFYAAGSADNFMSGNLGVTGTPDVNLHVANGSAKLRLGATASNAYLDISRDSATGFTIYNAAQTTFSSHIFQIAGTERARIATTGVISLGAAPGAESLRVTPVASAVNFWNFTGNTAGNSIGGAATGGDTNISLGFTTKGNGSSDFYSNNYGSLQFRIAHTASAVNYLQVTGAATGGSPYIISTGSDTNVGLNLTTKGASNIGFSTNNFGSAAFVIAHTASAVNFLQVTGGATSNGPVLTTQGSDANIFMVLSTKGTGSYLFATNNVTSTQFSVAHTASAVNYLTATGGATGNSAKLNASGSDTNIDIALTPKGTGVLQFGTYTAGVVVQAGYITIKDAGGTTRRLLVG